MPQVAPISKPEFRGKLSRTMLLFIIPIILLPILVVGGIAYFGARDLLQERNFAQLSTIESAIEKQITSWIEGKHVFLYNITKENEFSDSILKFLSMEKNDSEFISTGEAILSELNKANAQGFEPVFDYFVIVDQQGEILAAPLANWIGETVDAKEFFNNLTNSVQSQIIFRLHPFQASDTVVLTAAPILSENASTQGFVVAITRDDDLREFLRLAQIYPSSRAYFINTEKTYLGITELLKKVTRLEPTIEQKQALEVGLVKGLERGESYLEIAYPSFESESVFGIFTWIPDINSGVVIEVPTSTVYAHLNSLLPLAIGLVVALILALVFFVQLGAKQIVGPIVQVAQTANSIAQGEWQQRVSVTRRDEIGLLAYSFNEMAQQLAEFYNSMEAKVQERTSQIYAISDIESKMSSASTVDELLDITTWSINEKFDFYHIAIYELNPSRQYATLRKIAGERMPQMLSDRYTLNVNSHPLIKSSIASLEPSTTSSNDEIISFGDDRLPESQAAAIFPILFNEDIYGFLSLQSKHHLAFSDSMLAALRTISEHVTFSLRSIRIQRVTEGSLAETSHLYLAGQRISQAENWNSVENILVETFNTAPFISGVFVVEEHRFRISSISDAEGKQLMPSKNWLNIHSQDLETFLPIEESFLIIKDLESPQGLPALMLEIPKELNCHSLVIFPIYRGKRLSAFIMLGSQEADAFDSSIIQSYTNLIAMTNATLDKISAMRTINQQLAELQTIQEISQIVSQETDLSTLFQSLHEQVRKTMGDVSFLVTIYDKETRQVRIPYMYEKGSGLVSVPSFQLGEGLTSIVLKTKKPLMLIENTLERAEALGAKIIGVPAKSWLGVPMVVQNEAIGTITIQDMEHEQAFNEEDLELLTTLAPQIGIAIRNTIYLETTRKRALHQQRLFEATSKLRNSTDIQTILKTTTQEASKLFGAKIARIDISPRQEVPTQPDKETVIS